MVPIEVPIAVATNAEMMKMPAKMNCWGTKVRPRLAVASTPPIADATPENAPASRKITTMIIVLASAAPLQKVSIRYSRLRSLPPMHRQTSRAAISAAVRGICLKESPP